ncbi:MAG: glycerophosphodiester phosphodiesterase [Eubacteriaceae bacterium]|nr:glycerophosphodiester phosphodiesterase [Eubacteriaceae bacterium]
MIFPRAGRKRTLPEGLYAHRGLYSDIIPENSLSAFEAAAREGYGVELDIQYTKDMRLVVFHDEYLERMCRVKGKVSDYTYEQLERFSLNGTAERIPLFSDVLRVMGSLPVICEIKTQNGIKNTDICPSALQHITSYGGFICMESFNPYIVRWFRLNAPYIIRGQLSCKPEKADINGFFLWQYMVNILSRPDFLAFDYKQSSLGFILATKLFGAQSVGYTPKGKTEVEKALNSFDRVIFEQDTPKVKNKINL